MPARRLARIVKTHPGKVTAAVTIASLIAALTMSNTAWLFIMD